ncbi:MAG: CinA family protein [Ruminococcus sp.]|nr:CinA family protein [Ruminococcus sp.]
MVTLTDIDIIQLLRKNNLNQDTLQEDVVEKLSQKGLKVATAESCTGGLLSERITRVSGSSAVFDCGICSYSNSIKEKVLGVEKETLAVLGAVSAETAIQMAEGVFKLSGADIAVSTTGIAGPTGGTAEKPVGLVFMGVCTKEKAYAVKLTLGGEHQQNTRAYIRKLTTDAALFTVLSECYHTEK